MENRENNVFRNNGIKFNWDTLTDSEKLGLIGHSQVRAFRVLGELAHVVDLAVQEGLVVVDYGEFTTETDGPTEPEAA